MESTDCGGEGAIPTNISSAVLGRLVFQDSSEGAAL